MGAVMNQLAPVIAFASPALIAAGARASYRFPEFFTAQIRNATRAAPMREQRRNSSIGSQRRASQSLRRSRRIATRYDKLAANFAAAVMLAAVIIWWT
jgi:hypothetical protein